MATSAGAIIRASLLDLGIIQPSETVGPDMAQDGLLRLNNLVSGFQTQPQTSNAVVRTLFPITADKQTYTIGLGGDFNVPRPTKITNAGLLMEGLADAESVTSITRVGYTATVTQTAHGFAVGDEAFIQGADQPQYNGLQTVQTVPTANTYTFTVNGLPVTPATGTLTAAAVDGEPVEIGRSVITVEAYQSINIKNLPNSLFTNVYYVPTFPYGQIVLWPKPNTAINQLVLYLDTVFTAFVGLTTQYDWPSLPGYAEMLQYQLDLRLAIVYGTPASAEIHDMARKSLGLVKRANNKLVDLPTDASMLTHWPSGLYNINSGTTQGTGN